MSSTSNAVGPSRSAELRRRLALLLLIIGVGVIVGVLAFIPLGRIQEHDNTSDEAPEGRARQAMFSTDEAHSPAKAPADRGALSVGDEDAPAADEALTHAKLKPATAVNFVGGSFVQFLDSVTAATGLSYRFAGGPPREAPLLNISMEGIPRGAILRWACRQAGYSYRVVGDEIVLRPTPGSLMAAPPPDANARAWSARAAVVLDGPVSVQLEECQLDYAVYTLAKVSDLNIVIDPRMDRECLVSVSADGRPAREVISAVCEQSGLSFALVDYVVLLADAETIAALGAVPQSAADERVKPVF